MKDRPVNLHNNYFCALFPVASASCLCLSSVICRCRPPTYHSQPKGRVHLHVEYEPKGIQPATNDVVFLESFARFG